uniref:Uncharacterized protein n=1 Tax=Timema tahoe TaxID=61484 RepID=A0A7R9IIT3_9NEOP|nr:unnamed protein product [Timema tahoe]
MYRLSLVELQKQTQLKQDQTLGSPTSVSRVKVDISSGCCNRKLGHTSVVAGSIQGSGAWRWSRTGAILDSRNKGRRTEWIRDPQLRGRLTNCLDKLLDT